MKNHKTVAQLRSRQAEDAQPSRAGSLALLGGALCLNFTNTTSGAGFPPGASAGVNSRPRMGGTPM